MHHVKIEAAVAEGAKNVVKQLSAQKIQDRRILAEVSRSFVKALHGRMVHVNTSRMLLYSVDGNSGVTKILRCGRQQKKSLGGAFKVCLRFTGSWADARVVSEGGAAASVSGETLE